LCRDTFLAVVDDAVRIDILTLWLIENVSFMGVGPMLSDIIVSESDELGGISSVVEKHLLGRTGIRLVPVVVVRS